MSINKKSSSLGLNTRVKDMRNHIANYVYHLDVKKNIPYTIEDENEKLRIFDIPNSKTDFITGKKLTGIGEHYYPLCKDRLKHLRIGSDSYWNRIPTTGTNTTYMELNENKIKVEKWIQYCESRGAILFYPVSDEINNIIIKTQNELVEVNERGLDRLLSLQ